MSKLPQEPLYCKSFLVDSRMRDMAKYPNPANYRISVNPAYRSVKRMTLNMALIPKTEGNVNAGNQTIEYFDFSTVLSSYNNTFVGSLGNVSIPTGTYTLWGLKGAIQDALTALYGPVSVSFTTTESVFTMTVSVGAGTLDMVTSTFNRNFTDTTGLSTAMTSFTAPMKKHTLTATIPASNYTIGTETALGNMQGWATATVQVGNTIYLAVASPVNDMQGAVTIYRRDATNDTSTFVQDTILVSPQSTTTKTGFGYSLAMGVYGWDPSDDGVAVIIPAPVCYIGAPNEDTNMGAVYAFVRYTNDTHEPMWVATRIALDTSTLSVPINYVNEPRFGTSVACVYDATHARNYVAIGCPGFAGTRGATTLWFRATTSSINTLYTLDGTVSSTDKVGAEEGTSVSLTTVEVPWSGGGTHTVLLLCAGAPRYNSFGGHVYLYACDPTGITYGWEWYPISPVAGSITAGAMGDEQGSSVAIRYNPTDGNEPVLAIGSPGANTYSGQVETYTLEVVQTTDDGIHMTGFNYSIVNGPNNITLASPIAFNTDSTPNARLGSSIEWDLDADTGTIRYLAIGAPGYANYLGLTMVVNYDTTAASPALPFDATSIQIHNLFTSKLEFAAAGTTPLYDTVTASPKSVSYTDNYIAVQGFSPSLIIRNNGGAFNAIELFTSAMGVDKFLGGCVRYLYPSPVGLPPATTGTYLQATFLQGEPIQPSGAGLMQTVKAALETNSILAYGVSLTTTGVNGDPIQQGLYNNHFAFSVLNHPFQLFNYYNPLKDENIMGTAAIVLGLSPSASTVATQAGKSLTENNNYNPNYYIYGDSDFCLTDSPNYVFIRIMANCHLAHVDSMNRNAQGLFTVHFFDSNNNRMAGNGLVTGSSLDNVSSTSALYNGEAVTVCAPAGIQFLDIAFTHRDGSLYDFQGKDHMLYFSMDNTENIF